jgi:hypothetical protein
MEKNTNPYGNIGLGFSEVICDKKEHVKNSKSWLCSYCGQQGMDGFSEDELSEGYVECPNNKKGLPPSYDI